MNIKDQKYGDDDIYEALADTKIFCPLASLLVDALYKLSLTPNMITILSTICTLSSIYFYHNKNNLLFVILFLFGYLFDCVDGKLARRYNMGSDFGMALDLVSDNISHLVLLIYILINKSSNKFILVIIFMMILLTSISYGLNEAISSYNLTKNDNFYIRRKIQFHKKAKTFLESVLYKIFLLITKSSYQTYKLFFSEYNLDKINSWLNILKHFGPGNYTIIILILLVYIN
jgi:phosphatidylglycerophosphate synthase